MATLGPDERAAGVISGADPYRELELYLEKVNEEIGEVFSQWKASEASPSIAVPTPNGRLANGGPRSPAERRARTNEWRARDDGALVEWSESLLAEFNDIIACELRQLQQEAAAMKLKVTRSRSWDSEQPPAPSRGPLARAFGRHRQLELAADADPSGAVLVRVASLPDAELLHSQNSPKNPPVRPTTLDLRSKPPRKGNSKATTSLDFLKSRTNGTADSWKHKETSVESLRRKESTESLVRKDASPDFLLRKDSSNSSDALRSSSEGLLSSDSEGHFLKTPDSEEPPIADDMNQNRSLPVAFQSLLTRLRPSSEASPLVDSCTQTSPCVSRSSSFTWVSDCSSSMLLHPSDREDTLSSASSTSSSASSSSDGGCSLSTDSPEPESGIGTASPPRSRQELANPSTVPKVRRKETWERLRRRQLGSRPVVLGRSGSPEVWVRRESVETQTTSRSQELLLLSSHDEPDNEPDTPTRPSRPRYLPLSRRSPVPQQPSPSTASLKLGASPIVADLGNKSSSAPLLAKKATSPVVKPEDGKKGVLSQPRSQSERHLAEIEAAEACKWLRAAGFPQYAQMYEDLQFPIDVSGVQKDHPFLDADSLQSLFRRLQALNRCAKMKVDAAPKAKPEESDEEDQCALSDNWTFQPESRRWSRVCEVAQHAERLQALASQQQQQEAAESDDEAEARRYSSLPPGAAPDPELLAARFRRSGSERLKDSARALLRRMESLKTRRRKRAHRGGVVISGPQVLDVMTMEQRMKDLNCVDVSPGDGPDDSSSYCSDGSSTTPPHATRMRRLRRSPMEDVGALSDSEVQPTNWKDQYFKDANSNHTKVLKIVDGRSHGTDEDSNRHLSSSSKPPPRTGSLNMGKDSQRYRDRVQQAFQRDRDKSCSSELTASQESNSTLASQPDSDHEDSEVTPRLKAVVVRWHSFQRGSLRPDSGCLEMQVSHLNGSRPISSLSCGQLLVLRKLALLKLTACMERYCPTHRTGWNWDLPKFIRKIKAPDYKDKTVFGVPLLLSLQRTGQPLPKCIQMALRWLRMNALDQVGIFRKSGVRSRIQKLKQMTETQGEAINYEGQQAYDVADMVKQYFRELPEALLTNKLSETFIAIFQHVPSNLRHEAVQWVLLLLPDEHRETLQTLLEFLGQVSARSAYNQMTPSNLAVCLAPSLFHLHNTPSRSASASPRRRKTVGVPDQRELCENKAAHDCLLYLIRDYKELFTISEELLSQCHFTYMEESVPVALEELGAEFQQDWRGYLNACTSALLKEARDKSRGWVSTSYPSDPQVEMAYKKVGDGHPLRLWKVWTEVEAPPQELLQRVLRERHVWDYSLLKWRIVARLDPQVEVFQYVCASMSPLAAKDYCVLRSWRTDLAKGACVIVETSVEHPDGPVMLGGVRGIVLASRYLIEPCGSGKSRILHLSRVDTKGRTPEWYNKSYGHICALHLSRIRSSFKHNTDGPESKV